MSDDDSLLRDELLFPILLDSIPQILQLILSTDKSNQQKGIYYLQEYILSLQSKPNYKELILELGKEIFRSFETPSAPILMSTTFTDVENAKNIQSTAWLTMRLQMISKLCEMRFDESDLLMRKLFSYSLSLLPITSNTKLNWFVAEVTCIILKTASIQLALELIESVVSLFNDWIHKEHSWKRYSVLCLLISIIKSNPFLLKSYWEKIWIFLLEYFCNEINETDFENSRSMIAECICLFQREFDVSGAKIPSVIDKLEILLSKSSNSFILLEMMLKLCFCKSDTFVYSLQMHRNLYRIFMEEYKIITDKFAALNSSIKEGNRSKHSIKSNYSFKENDFQNIKKASLQTISAFSCVYSEYFDEFLDSFLDVICLNFDSLTLNCLSSCCLVLEHLDNSEICLKIIVTCLNRLSSFNLNVIDKELVDFLRISVSKFSFFTTEQKTLIKQYFVNIFNSEVKDFDLNFVDFCVELLKLKKSMNENINDSEIAIFLIDFVSEILLEESFSGCSLYNFKFSSSLMDFQQQTNQMNSPVLYKVAFYALKNVLNTVELKRNVKTVDFLKNLLNKFISNTEFQFQITECLLQWEFLIEDFDIFISIVENCIISNSVEYKNLILKSISVKFDMFLSNTKIANLIVLLCSDPEAEIQFEAFKILKRISHLNPISILPTIHQMALNHLVTLQNAQLSIVLRQSSFTLYLLLHLLGKRCYPLIDSLFKCLSSNFNSSYIDVAVNSLKAIQILFRTCGKKTQQYVFALFPELLQLTLHPDCRKRLQALKTMGDAFFYSATAHLICSQQPRLLSFALDLLKTKSQNVQINREVLRILGLIGAIDPYKISFQQLPSLSEVPSETLPLEALSLPSSSASEDFYPVIVINALAKIIQNENFPKLFRYDAYITCLRVLYLSPPKVMMHFDFIASFITGLVKNHKFIASSDMVVSACTELILVGREHALPYLKDLVYFCIRNWNENALFSETHIEFIYFIVAIKIALHQEVTKYLSQFVPFMLRMLQAFSTSSITDMRKCNQSNLITVIGAFGALSIYLSDYLLYIIQPLLQILQIPDIRLDVKIAVYGLFDLMQTSLNLSRVWLNIWNTCFPLLGNLASDFEMQTFLFLLRLTRHYSSNIYPFERMLCQKYSQLFSQEDVNSITGNYMPQLPPFQVPSKVIGFSIDQLNPELPKYPWHEIPLFFKGDWEEWFRSFTIKLIWESPSQALRVSTELGIKFAPFAKELFYPSFLSNWLPIDEQYHDDIVQVVENVLVNPHVPPEIIHSFLNLAEFVEHDEKELPIDYKTLGAFSSKSHAYAKALHYRELEYLNDPHPSTVEALLGINTQLQLPDAATGILTHSQKMHSIELRENWYEKLHRWPEALQVYKEKLKEDPTNDEAFIGLLRCKHVIGDWENIFSLVKARWPSTNESLQTTVAPLAAASAWALSSWDELNRYLQCIHEETPEGRFFRAISNVHEGNFAKAQNYINLTRDSISTDITALLTESYGRAYNAIIRVQLLTELEEIIIYKTSEHERKNIEELWSKRLLNVQPNVDVWHRILKVRSLLFSHAHSLSSWLEFLSLCRKQDRWFIGSNTLRNILAEYSLDMKYLQDVTNFSRVDARLTLTSIKYAWELEGKTPALSYLKKFVDWGVSERSNEQPRVSTEILSKAFRVYGNWLLRLKDKGITRENQEDVLNAYFLSTKYHPSSFKAWHRWAVANFEVVTIIERKGDPSNRSKLPMYLTNSVKGFLRSLALNTGKSDDLLQDILRFVTILFKYGSNHEINQIITEGIPSVQVDAWLNVIPQIIARIHAPSPHVRRLVHQILLDVARTHPQSIIYSLTVASKSQNQTRRQAALSLLSQMRSLHPILVDQALLVSHELIRVSVLWHEMWHEGLEEASRRYFGDNNIPAMFSVLDSLHQLLEKGPETPLEESFLQSYGKELNEAREWCKKYNRTGNATDLNQAWDLYYGVFRELTRQVMHMNVLHLAQVSPRLLEINDFELTVPGTYLANSPSSFSDIENSHRKSDIDSIANNSSSSNYSNLIKIRSFRPLLYVIGSKQRPRKVEIIGSNGISYCYLLKGREDIRQDQRVMQFFSLVNNCLQSDFETSNRHLKIRIFPVIPLSPNSGLIGWVHDCDTLHSLVKDFRETHSVPLNIEHRIMLQMAPDYDNLTILQKIETFQHALENTSGLDLAKILWLRSSNSEQWLQRRTVYIRSLAVMSIVGYVLGLGDRHPSNLLIDRCTGGVIHIDFGDCFEAAMFREKFPEKIPFRLTRMLICAMEASGVEGTFRITCEHTARVLRANRESLMAILETFIYDPLVTSKMSHSTKAMHDSYQNDPAPQHTSRDFSLAPGTFVLCLGKDAEFEGDSENVNSRSLQMVRRVSNKLSGRDFGSKLVAVDIETQVSKLIEQATSVENLSQCYIGWCPFW